MKKNQQVHMEELYEKRFNDLDNHDGVVTHLEPDILQYEVKWAFGSTTMNKASGGDRIPAELFKILNGDAVEFNCIHIAFNMSANLEDSVVATGLKKVSFHSKPK